MPPSTALKGTNLTVRERSSRPGARIGRFGDDARDGRLAAAGRSPQESWKGCAARRWPARAACLAPTRCACPTSSSRVRGRMRSASGVRLGRVGLRWRSAEVKSVSSPAPRTFGGLRARHVNAPAARRRWRCRRARWWRPRRSPLPDRATCPSRAREARRSAVRAPGARAAGEERTRVLRVVGVRRHRHEPAKLERTRGAHGVDDRRRARPARIRSWRGRRRRSLR